MKDFNEFGDSYTLVRALKKETQNVGEYLVAQGQVESDVVDEFNKTGTLSHFLLLN